MASPEAKKIRTDAEEAVEDEGDQIMPALAEADAIQAQLAVVSEPRPGPGTAAAKGVSGSVTLLAAHGRLACTAHMFSLGVLGLSVTWSMGCLRWRPCWLCWALLQQQGTSRPAPARPLVLLQQAPLPSGQQPVACPYVMHCILELAQPLTISCLPPPPPSPSPISAPSPPAQLAP
jgi:hypothetical protein